MRAPVCRHRLGLGRAARLGWAGRRVGAWLPCNLYRTRRSFVVPLYSWNPLSGKGIRRLHGVGNNEAIFSFQAVRARRRAASRKAPAATAATMAAAAADRRTAGKRDWSARPTGFLQAGGGPLPPRARP